MSEQAKALVLAAELDRYALGGNLSWMTAQDAAIELRRLHSVNAELLEALQLVRMSAGWQHLSGESKAVIDSAIRRALGQ